MASMDSLTYARSTAGQKKLISEINSDIDRAISALTGSQYSELLKTVKANWVGADEQKFEKVLRESIKDITTKFKAYKTELQQVILQDSTKFAKMQQSNADSITKR